METVTNVGNVQIIVAIIMLAGVIAAYLTALLNWRSSPVLLATKEKHSKDLMQVLDEWKSEIVNRGLPGYYPPEEVQQRYAIEQHVLFNDLKNHIPHDLELFERWHRFKTTRSELDITMARYYEHIKGHLERSSRLRVLSRQEESKGRPIGITHWCPQWFYAKLLEKAEDMGIPGHLRVSIPDHTPTELKGHDGNIWAWTASPSEALLLRDLLHTMLANIEGGQSGTDEHDLFLEAKGITDARNELQQLRDTMLSQIAEIQAIPILTGNCKHIARAREPLFPNWKPKRMCLPGLVLFPIGLVLTAIAVIRISSIGLFVGGMVIMAIGFGIVVVCRRK